jgi:hypothetical protein
MKKLKRNIALFATLTLAANLSVAEQIGQVIALDGAAALHSPVGEIRDAELASPIYLQDRVVTHTESKVQIMFLDDSIISIGQNSEMTIDEYVYSPERAEESKSKLSFLKGMFRVITAKITDINPDKFEVKSNMSTIGIRGCELAFDIRETQEEIQIVRVPEEKDIIVQSMLNADDELHIPRQGLLITQTRDTGLMKRKLTESDIRRLYDATTPSTAHMKPKYNLGRAKAGWNASSSRRANEVERGQDLADGDVFVEDSTIRDQHDNPETLIASAQEVADRTTLNIRGSRAESAFAEVIPELEIPEPAVKSPVPADTPVETEVADVAEVQPPEPTPPSVPNLDGITFPIAGIAVNTPQGGGQDWSWGTWSRKDITGVADGTPETMDVAGVSIQGNPMASSDYTALAGSATPRALRGAGIAAAGIMQDNKSTVVTGTSDIRLVLGGNVAPTWSGAFDMNNAQGDSLSFQGNGVLSTADGSLSASASAYKLNAFGAAHDASTLSENQISGSLVGNGNVTGTIGDFRFRHGVDGPAVDGVFGSDLN